MLNKVAVIIPFYRAIISDYEKIALQQCERVLPAYPKIAIKPQSLALPAEADAVNFTGTISFDDHYFEGFAGYNKLMLSPQFYSQFTAYEYILIYQMDCFVFKDELNYWCNQGWDYIGAPWIKKTYHRNTIQMCLFRIREYFLNHFSRKGGDLPTQQQLNNNVGNGGFSLRRVQKFYDVCREMKPTIDLYLSQKSNLYNEDVFWSIEVNREKRVLNIPSCATGLKFAFEVPPFKADMLNEQNLPFGCHDWDHYVDFWQPVFKQYGYDI